MLGFRNNLLYEFLISSRRLGRLPRVLCSLLREHGVLVSACPVQQQCVIYPLRLGAEEQKVPGRPSVCLRDIAYHGGSRRPRLARSFVDAAQQAVREL